MATFKQELPPPGGFSSVVYKRIPLKRSIPSAVGWLLMFGCMGVGWSLYHMEKNKKIYETIEKRSALFSITPLLIAENDRIRLRNILRSRDFEADLMKDVEGWTVGTYYGEPIYKTLKPNDWFEPHSLSMWIHSDLKDYYFAERLGITH